jgi:hypothetical protein
LFSHEFVSEISPLTPKMTRAVICTVYILI